MALSEKHHKIAGIIIIIAIIALIIYILINSGILGDVPFLKDIRLPKIEIE